MSGIIHMETELVRGGGQKITYTAADYIEMADQLRRSAGSLGVNWLGPSAADYVNDLERLADSIRTQSLRLDELGNRVLREVDEWVNADQLGSQLNSSNPANNIISGAPGQSTSGAKAPFYLGFGVMIINGIHYSLGVVQDQWNRTLNATTGMINQAISQSDQAIDKALSGYLGNPLPGDSESVRFESKGGVSIPGAEVGVPGSFKLAGAKEMELTRKDGKYYFKLTTESGAGLEESALEAKGGVKLGKNKYSIGVESSVEAMAKGEVEVVYEFDPRKPGDMTKMAGFMFGVGAADSVAGPLASPPLIAMKDNMHSLKVSQGAEVEGKVNANVLIKLAGVEGKIGNMDGVELRKNASGGWETVQHSEVGSEVKANLVTFENGVKGDVHVESITDLTTGKQTSKVIMEIKAEEGRAIDISKIGKYVPDMKKSALQGLSGSSAEYKGLKVEYSMDGPADNALNMINDPGQGMQAIKQGAHKMEIYSTTEVEQGIGVEGKVAIPTQKIGLDVEANGVRSSERRIYPPN